MRRNRTVYAINRYYSPETGRFTTHDPLTELDRPDRLNQPQRLNLYPYVMGGPTRYTDPTGEDWIYGPDNQAKNVRSVEKGQRRISDKHTFEVTADEGNFKVGDELQYLSGGRVLIKVAGRDQPLPAGTIITYDYNQIPIHTQPPVAAPPPLDPLLATCHGSAEPATGIEADDAPTVGNPEMVVGETQASCINDGYVNVPIRIPANYVDLGSVDVPAEMSRWEISAAPPMEFEDGFYEYQRELFFAKTGADDGTVLNPAYCQVIPGDHKVTLIPATAFLPESVVEEIYGPRRVPYEEVSTETFERMFLAPWVTVAAMQGGRGSVGIGKGSDKSFRYKDFNVARNVAVEWLERRGFKAERPTIGKFEENAGRPVGMKSADGKTGFRVEFDDRHRAHINVWSRKSKDTFLFEGTQSMVDQIVKQFVKERP